VKKFNRTYSSTLIDTKNHWMVGTEWTAIGSKGDPYTILMKDSGFECSCPAFRKCKHINEIEERIAHGPC